MKIFVYILALIFAILSLVSASVPEMDGLKVEVLREGQGSETVKKGDNLSMHYRGSLASDGSEFDASYNRGQPFSVQIGVGQVIKGWDEGLIGMKVGEKRKLTIAPELGYGSRGIGPIPGGATLIFETECLSINGKGKDEL